MVNVVRPLLRVAAWFCTFGTIEQSLESAVEADSLPLARLAIAGGADVNEEYIRGADCYGDKVPLYSEGTALLYAARRGQTRMVELLLKNGANVHENNYFWGTALHCAAQQNLVEMAKLLIKAGADVNAKGGSCNSRSGHYFDVTPLHVAAFEGHAEMAKFLLENGAKIETEEHESNRPLHVAASEGHVEVARLLLEKGAEAGAKNWQKKTPLDKAVSNRRHELAELFPAATRQEQEAGPQAGGESGPATAFPASSGAGPVNRDAAQAPVSRRMALTL